MSDAPTAAPGVENWRAGLLQRVLVASVVLIAFALGAIYLSGKGSQRYFILGSISPLLAFDAFLIFKPSWPYRLRSGALLLTLVVSTYAGYLVVGFLGNAAAVGALTVVVAGLLVGRRMALVFFLVLLVAPVAAAVGMVHGTLPLPNDGLVSITEVRPWVRTTAVAAFVWLSIAFAITFAVTHLEAAFASARGAIADLKAAELRREEAERGALQAQKLEAAGKVAAGVAHDFNNVLMVIQAWAAMGMGPKATPGTQQKGREMIDAAVRQGGALARQLLALARQNVRSLQRLSLRNVVEETSQSLGSVLPGDIELRVELDTDTPHVRADESELQQVMFNLVINARDAMPEGGRLRIATGAESFETAIPCIAGELAPGRWAFVSVEDSGTGMDPALQARIFEPFFTTKGAAGTGLGLVTVLAIARENGGGLRLDSAPGRGARFTIYLPQATDDVVAVAPTPTAARGRSQPAKILVVEDNPLVRDALEELLALAGHTVTVTCDGRRALAEIEKPDASFNLLCCDAVLPLPSARSVIDAFEERFPGAPVLVVSGHVQEDLTRRGIEQGRYHMLSKPFEPPTLEEAIERLLGHGSSPGRAGDSPSVV